jgi:thymidylate synthase
MKPYLLLLERVLTLGIKKDDRTKTGTLSLFGVEQRYDLREGFPLLTTKEVNFKAIVSELLWFIRGETNIVPLLQEGVHIWDEWPYQKYTLSPDYQGETIQEFRTKLLADASFGKQYGELGPIYGKQWRNFQGVDQLQQVIQQIKTNPDSRRLIISSWDASVIDQMALPPCHVLMQFYCAQDELSLLLYQRSGDLFLGVPFNIASYALLLQMVAQVTDKKAKELIHVLGDCHLYLNHVGQAKKQLSRQPLPLPQIRLNPAIKEITEFSASDINLIGYVHASKLPGKVAV